MTDAWRRLARTSTRHLAWRRRLPKAVGGATMLVSTEGGLKYLRPRLQGIDPPLEWFARQAIEPGSCVWDVGANIGLFTFMATGLTGPRGTVVAFEPDATLVVQLWKSARFNEGRDVRIVPVALAGTRGIREFVVARRSRATSHLMGFGSSQTDGARYVQHVLVETIDEMAQRLPVPDVLKVDVERAELQVLTGAMETLRTARPLVLCEVGDEVRDAITSLLRGLDYRLFDAETHRPTERASYSTVACPSELVDKFGRRLTGG